MKTLKNRKQGGASMIEVMVALVILSIGLLGLAMLQGKTMRVNTNAMVRSQATLLANEIIDGMRANTLGADKGFYAVDLSSGAPTVCGGCNDTDGHLTASKDIVSWYNAQTQTLPSPSSKIVWNGNGSYTITMEWDERGIKTSQIWEVTI